MGKGTSPKRVGLYPKKRSGAAPLILPRLCSWQLTLDCLRWYSPFSILSVVFIIWIYIVSHAENFQHNTEVLFTIRCLSQQSNLSTVFLPNYVLLPILIFSFFSVWLHMFFISTIMIFHAEWGGGAVFHHLFACLVFR